MSQIDSTRSTMSNSGLIGSSPKFLAVLDQVNKVASANCTDLIQGETGTRQGTALQGESGAARQGGAGLDV